MASKKYHCPLCGKSLSERLYLSITGRWEQLRKVETKFRKEMKCKVDKARRIERNRVSNDIVVLNHKIISLRGQLKHLKEQSEHGLTPQLEGLLYEKELAKQLTKRFPQDRIVPAGKRGDVIHHVYLNSTQVGTIVYECKKVIKLQRSHVEQARRTLSQRSADYAVLVTTARKRNTFGFWTEKDVLVVHPAGAIDLVGWLRETLIEFAKARVSKGQRERAAREVLNFLGSPEFRNPMQDAIRRTEEMGKQLKKEVRLHRTWWLKRFDSYQAVWVDARTIVQAVAAILEKRMGANPRRKLPAVRLERNGTYPLKKDALLLNK